MGGGGPPGGAPFRGGAREGDWFCGSCGNDNFSWRTECKQCGCPKSSGGMPAHGAMGGPPRWDGGHMMGHGAPPQHWGPPPGAHGGGDPSGGHGAWGMPPGGGWGPWAAAQAQPWGAWGGGWPQDWSAWGVPPGGGAEWDGGADRRGRDRDDRGRR